MIIDDLILELQKQKNPQKAKLLMGFFKTGKGEYGEGDIFLGVIVPAQRAIANKYHKAITLPDIETLLKSPIHEYRLTALIALTLKTKKADKKTKKQYCDFYIKNSKYINNWDLVDVTCRDVVGEYLLDEDRSILYKLARSRDLWEKRIAIISTFAFIRQKQLEDSLKIAGILVNDKHDLIHKAVGWTLREVGKIDRKKEEQFLKKHYKTMPRTALRYAIEKFPGRLRDFYLGRPPTRE
jgi:3-methyladenine DNA glycosylase AlkD